VIAHDGDAHAHERGRAEGDLGPERLTDLHETLERVNRALRGLGPKKARVVYLHDVLGYQLEEVATMLGTSVAAAQSRLVRGRREIIETIGPESDPIVRRGRGAAVGEARPRRRRPRSLVLT
jgi:DNA-directed RNA polymerase specialized sigma24 family protein